MFSTTRRADSTVLRTTTDTLSFTVAHRGRDSIDATSRWATLCHNGKTGPIAPSRVFPQTADACGFGGYCESTAKWWPTCGGCLPSLLFRHAPSQIRVSRYHSSRAGGKRGKKSLQPSSFFFFARRLRRWPVSFHRLYFGRFVEKERKNDKTQHARRQSPRVRHDGSDQRENAVSPRRHRIRVAAKPVCSFCKRGARQRAPLAREKKKRAPRLFYAKRKTKASGPLPTATLSKRWNCAQTNETLSSIE